MIFLNEYADISGRVYKKPATSYFGKSYSMVEYSKIRHNTDGWYQIDDVPNQPTYSPGFYAALFIKFDHGRPTDAVVAIRGTDSVKDGLVDGIAWFSDVVFASDEHVSPLYMSEAIRFFVSARQYLRRHFSDSVPLSLTGHSLGGAIAQLLVVQYGQPYFCVTFNAPGVGAMRGVNQDMGGYILNINTSYGVINKVGKSVPNSKTIWVSIQDKEQDSKKIFKAFSQRLFDQSKKLHKAASKIPLDSFLGYGWGLIGVERVLAYGSGLTGIVKTQTYADGVRACERQHMQVGSNMLTSELFFIYNIDVKEYCHVKHLGDAVGIVASQHSIDSMVSVLHSHPSLGNRSLAGLFHA